MNTTELKELTDLRNKSIKLQNDIKHINKKRQFIVIDMIQTNKRIAELRKKI